MSSPQTRMKWKGQHWQVLEISNALSAEPMGPVSSTVISHASGHTPKYISSQSIIESHCVLTS
eukprot:11978769-Ditylum_brightwellii.AAC.1